MDTTFQALASGRLDYREIEAVVGEAGQRLIRRSKLDKQGAGFTVAAWPALEMAQQRRLMSACE